MGGKKKGGTKLDKGGGDEGKGDESFALANELEEMANKLAAERVVVGQLRAINADQSAQLVQAEALVKSETEKHSAEMWLLYDETTTAKEEAAHQNEVLTQRVRSLEAEVEGLRVLEDENQRLRDRVGRLMSEVDKAAKDHASETHRLKKEVFNLRMQLEQTFRKAMQELDAEYKQRALSNLDNESKNALKANAKLQAELTMQTEGIEALMTKYKAMEAAFTKLKIEHDVLQKNTSLQETRIGGLRRANLVAASQLEELQVGAVGQGKQKIKELSEALAKERAARSVVEEELATWKARHDALERKTAYTIKRMRDAQRRKERMLREKRTGKTGKKGSTGEDRDAAASRSSRTKGAGGAHDPASLPPHPLEGYGFPQIGVEQSVGAFDAYTDILAIWNSNFPTPHTHGASGAGGGDRSGGGSTGGGARRAQRSRSHAALRGGRASMKMRGMEPGMKRDTSMPSALLPRDARQLARSLRPPTLGGGHKRDSSGLPSTRGSSRASAVSGVDSRDVGNLDVGLGDILRRSRTRMDGADSGGGGGGGGGSSDRNGNGNGPRRLRATGRVSPLDRSSRLSSRQSSKSSLGDTNSDRFFAP